jgi:CofD-related protein of GAK system
MPAIGDIRNRLLALADFDDPHTALMVRLFRHRLPGDASAATLRAELAALVDGRHSLLHGISRSGLDVVRKNFLGFVDHMPRDFRLPGASIGNLVLAGAYLQAGRRLNPVIDFFSAFLRVQGIVRPIVDSDLNLAADLENGLRIIGQHLLTGKESDPIGSRIRRLDLVDKNQNPVSVRISSQVRRLIQGADLICYPMGSFYSSLIALFLPQGVAEAIAANPCPKVFVPATVFDPECPGMVFSDQAREIVRYLVREEKGMKASDVLTYVLVDSGSAIRLQPEVTDRQVRIVSRSLISPGSTPYIDPELLADTLYSLALKV